MVSVQLCRGSEPAQFDQLETSVRAAIAACDGNERAAVRGLIVAVAFLEEELKQARAMVSRGYCRGAAAR
jgi:hypothetical protein